MEKRYQQAYETYSQTTPAWKPEAIIEMIGRVIGIDCCNRFSVRVLPEEGTDTFILSDREGKIDIQANSGTAAAGAFRFYLEDILSYQFSVLGREPIRLQPDELLPVGQTIRRSSRFLYRYFLNYCTYGYTFAFWQFEDFERLLDYAAMSGYNLVLNILAHEVVTRRMLEKVGYPSWRISQYLSGPAFLPWQWMQNISAHAGPLPQGWGDDRVRLSRRFNARAMELGIRIMMPGFGGVIPNDFQQVFPASMPLVQGDWCGLVRPDILLPTDPMFSVMAKAFYEATAEIFGREIAFFSADPFHEGGKSEGVDLAAMGEAIFQPMIAYNPRAVWALQAWQNNPDRTLLNRIPRGRVLIMDLLAQYRNRDGFDHFNGYPWLYCTVNNFGAQRQIRGNVAASLSEPFAALELTAQSCCVGYGLMPEGVAADDVLYDIYTQAAFGQKPQTIEEYVPDYVRRRYGSQVPEAVSAWEILANKVYITGSEGVRESILCARPGLHLKQASVYGTDVMPYCPVDLMKAVKLLFAAYSLLKNREGYRFDLIDLTRQMLSNVGWEIYDRVMRAYDEQDLSAKKQAEAAFLELMSLTDSICSHCEHMRLDAWVLKARALGSKFGATALMEENARRIITLWANKEGSEMLHDYAQKEWYGMLSGLYRQRWERFFTALNDSLEAVCSVDFLAMEEAFVSDTDIPTEPPVQKLDILVKDAIVLAEAYLS